MADFFQQLRTEPRRGRRGEPRPASGTNNIPITLDRYAIGQRKAPSPEEARPPQGRSAENGDRELRNERGREPLPPGREAYDRVCRLSSPFWIAD
jgi:hypothetical protein